MFPVGVHGAHKPCLFTLLWYLGSRCVDKLQGTSQQGTVEVRRAQGVQQHVRLGDCDGGEAACLGGLLWEQVPQDVVHDPRRRVGWARKRQCHMQFEGGAELCCSMNGLRDVTVFRRGLGTARHYLYRCCARDRHMVGLSSPQVMGMGRCRWSAEDWCKVGDARGRPQGMAICAEQQDWPERSYGGVP